MMLGTGDLIAIIIALGTSLTLIITSALQNARLTRSRDQWRADYFSTREKLDACEASLLRAHTRETW
jgi:hypothetical protein